MKKHILSLDYLHVFIILLVVAFHSVIAYEAYIPVNTLPFSAKPYFWAMFPIMDTERSIGLALFVLFNDQFFMFLLFFISGLFTWGGLKRRGSLNYIKTRAFRLGIPFLVIRYLIVPIGYYPAYLNTGGKPGLVNFASQWIDLQPLPSGPMWFLSVLLLFDLIAAVSYKALPQYFDSFVSRMNALPIKPFIFFITLSAASALFYIPMVSIFDRYHWTNTGVVNFQTVRIFSYAIYFIAGIVIGAGGLNRGLLEKEGLLAKKWPSWFTSTIILYFLSLIFIGKHYLNPASSAYKYIYSILFIMFCTSCSLFFIGFFIRNISGRNFVADSLHRNAYGIFLIHYPVSIWIQYYLLGADLTAIQKGIIATLATLSISWTFIAAIRRIPAVWKILSPGDTVSASAGDMRNNLTETEICSES